MNLKLSKAGILTALLITSFVLANAANATETQNAINMEILGNDAALNSQYSVLDAGKINQIAYAPRKNNLDISDYTFMTKKQRQMKKMENKYAASDTDLVFDPINATVEDTNFWIRPYGSFEKVKTGEGKIKNENYGVYTGINTGLKELGNGWDAVWGGYIGYTGSHQHDYPAEMYQNGATIGVESMFLKDNFFTGLSANFGGNIGNFKLKHYASITAAYIDSGVTSRTGYNWELADGKFVIQPNFIASYIFAQTFGHSKSLGDGETLSVDANSLHAVQLEPALNFIFNLNNGWQPYIGASVVWNVAHSNHIAAMYASMPNMSSRTFVKYGAGLRKTWNDRYSANLQAFARNGGRTGVGIQGGFGVALGK